MKTIKIRFFDKHGDLIDEYDTKNINADEIYSWEDWYNDGNTEHHGPKDADGHDVWETFEVVYG